MSVGRGKVTKESAKDEKIIFYPKNDAETEYLQRRLFEEGFAWTDGDTKVGEQEACKQGGLIIINGLMYVKGDVNTSAFTVCSIRQVDQDCPSAEQQNLLDLFREMAGRLEHIEKRLGGIEASLAPEELDKQHSLKVLKAGAS